MGVSVKLRLLSVAVVIVCFLALSTLAAAADRFKKMDAQGKELPADAPGWAIIFDTKSELYWEVKTADKSSHAKDAVYTYTNVKDNFVAKINAENFGGHSDWRLPATDELAGLKKRKKNSPEALIDLQYFPETQPGRYMSVGWCGSKSEYQEESIKFGKQKVKGAKYVRAVRGKPLE